MGGQLSVIQVNYWWYNCVEGMHCWLSVPELDMTCASVCGSYLHTSERLDTNL